MSELPSGWELSCLNDLASAIGGGTPSKSDPLYWDAGTIPWVSPKDMKVRVIADSEDHVTEAALNRLSVVPSNSVLLVVRSGILSHSLPVAQNSVPVTLNQDMRAFVPRAQISSSFVAWQLIANEREILQSCSKDGTTVASIEAPALANYALKVAPTAEQARIVAKLEELLSDLDAGVAELKAAQRKLTAYRQSLLKHAVDGSLTAAWRAKNTPSETGEQLLQRILAERRARWEAKQFAKFKEQGINPPEDWQKKYQKPVLPDTLGLPELPKGWVWARVDQTGEIQLGRQRAPQFHSGENMVPYLRVANVFEDRIDVSDVMEMHFSKEDEASFRLSSGDILLNEGQSLELVGRPAIYRGELARACFTNTLLRFRVEAGVSSDYAIAVFLHYMHSGRFRKIAKITTNIAHLGAGRFAELEFPLPPINEQREIGRLLRAAMDDVQRQGTAIAVALKQAAAQRQNILRAAFAGQLVPQDPSDEPASVLLERIRAERAKAASVGPGRRSTKRPSATVAA